MKGAYWPYAWLCCEMTTGCRGLSANLANALPTYRYTPQLQKLTQLSHVPPHTVIALPLVHSKLSNGNYTPVKRTPAYLSPHRSALLRWVPQRHPPTPAPTTASAVGPPACFMSKHTPHNNTSLSFTSPICIVAMGAAAAPTHPSPNHSQCSGASSFTSSCRTGPTAAQIKPTTVAPTGRFTTGWARRADHADASL